MRPAVTRASSWQGAPTACLYCGGERFVPWLTDVRDRLDYVPGSWSFLKCAACGSAHLSPMPAPEAVPGLYPPIYSFRPDFESPSRLKRIVAALEERTFYRLLSNNEVATVRRHTGVTTGRLLDVGCGTGDRLTRFARAGYAVSGLELQPELVRYVRTTLGHEVHAATLDDAPYEPDSFDVITIHWVIEHLLDVQTALRHAHRLLKPGGWLVAEVPLADSWQSDVLGGRWCQYQEAPRHIAIPSREGASVAFARNGFAPVRIVPSGLMSCAGFFGLSMVPNGTAMKAYDNPSIATHLPRVLAGLVTLLWFPGALFENRVLGRPACGLIFGRKPPASS